VSTRAKRQTAVPDDFGVFYIETRLRTFRSVRRLAGDTDLAHDAVQEAYARILSIWSARRCRSVEANYLYTLAIARNFVFDWFRHNRRLVGLDDLDEPTLDDHAFGDVLDRMVLGRAIRAFLDHQPIGRRVVGVLFFCDGWTYREIATELGIKESTVRNHVHRLRVLLKPYRDRFDELMKDGERL
jgi:RNA polymerase sigma factor (sigma-70 family)